MSWRQAEDKQAAMEIKAKTKRQEKVRGPWSVVRCSSSRDILISAKREELFPWNK
jgi:hypothetical protein